MKTFLKQTSRGSFYQARPKAEAKMLLGRRAAARAAPPGARNVKATSARRKGNSARLFAKENGGILSGARR